MLADLDGDGVTTEQVVAALGEPKLVEQIEWFASMEDERKLLRQGRLGLCLCQGSPEFTDELGVDGFNLRSLACVHIRLRQTTGEHFPSELA